MPATSRDYYQVLGLSRTASLEDIKKAFRRLARQYHPDLHSGSKKTEMEKKFKELNEAYEVLSDQDTRKKYDRYGAQWEQAEAFEEAQRQRSSRGFHWQPSGGGFGGDAFADIFENMFGGRARGGPSGGFASQGEDLESEVELTLREVLSGVTKRVNLMEPIPCPACKGSGSQRGRRCQICLGAGTRMDSNTIEVRIPAGVLDGTRVRVAGKGRTGVNGGRRGDLYLLVTVKADKVFHRQGSDLHATLPVWPWEAALGAEVMAPTLGEPVRVKIPPGSRADSKLRLRSKGLPTAGGSHGDLFLTLQIVMPSSMTEKERNLYEQLARHSHQDPRADVINRTRSG